MSFKIQPLRTCFNNYLQYHISLQSQFLLGNSLAYSLFSRCVSLWCQSTGWMCWIWTTGPSVTSSSQDPGPWSWRSWKRCGIKVEVFSFFSLRPFFLCQSVTCFFSLCIVSVKTCWWNLQQNVLEKDRDSVIGFHITGFIAITSKFEFGDTASCLCIISFPRDLLWGYDDEGKKGSVSSHAIVTNGVQIGEIVLHRLKIRESIPKHFLWPIALFGLVWGLCVAEQG